MWVKQVILISTALRFDAKGDRRRDVGRKLPELLYDCHYIGGGQERCKVDECRAWFGTVKRGCIVRWFEALTEQFEFQNKCFRWENTGRHTRLFPSMEKKHLKPSQANIAGYSWPMLVYTSLRWSADANPHWPVSLWRLKMLFSLVPRCWWHQNKSLVYVS